MYIEAFIKKELDTIIKFLIWWNYNHEQAPDDFPLELTSHSDWFESYTLFNCEDRQFAVPDEYQLEDFDLDAIRKDLAHQITMPDDLDWDHFLETTIRARIKATAMGVNMVAHDE